MDRRIKYTKNVIKDTFINLLYEKEINKITVSEICQIADINRATFYRYYLDVYDLLDKIEEDFANDLKSVINNNDEDYTVSSFVKELLIVLDNNKDLSKVLFNNKITPKFLEDILNIAYEKSISKWSKVHSDLDKDKIDDAFIFIFNGALGMINYWIKNNFDKSPDELSSIIEKLSYNGINNFIE